MLDRQDGAEEVAGAGHPGPRRGARVDAKTRLADKGCYLALDGVERGYVGSRHGCARSGPVASPAPASRGHPRAGPQRRAPGRPLLHGRGGATQRAYAADLAAFFGHVQRPLKAVTLGDMQSFQDSLRTMATATEARRLSAVKSLLSLGHRTGYLPVNVGVAIRFGKWQSRPRSGEHCQYRDGPRTAHAKPQAACLCWQ